jgi:hypothetical protein
MLHPAGPLLFALALVCWAAGAAAHVLPRSYCTVRTAPGGIDVSVETAGHLLAAPLGLSSRHPDEKVLREAIPRFVQQIEDHVQARTPAGACTVKADPAEVIHDQGEPALRVMLHFGCPTGPVTLHNSWRFDVDPSSETVCAINGSAWVFRPGMAERVVGTPPTLGQVLSNFVVLGMKHVESGIDHILFVIGLLLAAALATRQQSLGSATRAVAGVVTGFTLGHSITLIAAGLGVVRLPSRFTESAIALSIVVVCVENIARHEIRGRFLTAALFGLVHGFGFASVLADIELPSRGTVLALVSFNVGIELAQLIVVVIAFPPLALASRRPWYRKRVLVPLSAAVALVAAVWLVKRALGLDFLPWLGS